MWAEEVDIMICHNNLQFVLMEESSPNRNWFMFTVVYGSPNFRRRQMLWSKLKDLEGYISLPWLVAGDFNAFLTIAEKKGRSSRGSLPCRKFKEWMSECDMFDLGFCGPKFTWNRGMLFERIDRPVGNLTWQEIFPETRVFHLPKVGSDHWPILIKPWIRHFRSTTMRLFKFMAPWVSHAD